MQTSKRTALFLAVFVLFVSAPAHAWFAWLDDLSGPGKFHGPQFVFRLICFGQESDEKRLIEGMTKANDLTLRIMPVLSEQSLRINDGIHAVRNIQSEIDKTNAEKREPSSELSNRLKAAQFDLQARYADARAAVGNSLVPPVEAWNETMVGIRGTLLTFPVLNKKAVDDYFTAVTGHLNALHRLALLEDANGASRAVSLMLFEPDELTNSAEKILAALQRTFADAIAPIDRGTAAVHGAGAFLSTCSNDTMRRASVEFMTSFLHADGSPLFAGGERIYLTTLVPEFTFRLFSDPRWDFVDAGAGAGMYWFSSPGFESFSGVILEPAFLNFRAPSVWNSYPLNSPGNLFRRLSASLTFRTGYTTFPAGFAPSAFAGVGVKNVRIPSELVPSWSLYFNIQPFVSRAPFVKRP
jgi:hypothetical protein